MELSVSNMLHSSPVKSELDPLDIFSTPQSPASTLVGSCSAVSILKKGNDSLNTTPEPLRTSKRVRSMLSLSENASDHPVKKPKVESTDLTVMASKRSEIDAAQRRFLSFHRKFFEPLLPHNSKFFERLSGSDIHEKMVARKELENQPELIEGGQMKDYQLMGLSFLVWMYENGMSTILGDEMGLGKTLQTLSLFAYIKESQKVIPDPHLILCPLSVLSSWMTEAARWIPSFNVLRFHGPVEERTRLKEEIRSNKFDLVVTTYETYFAEDSWFKSRRWTYCVLDEGHRIKDSTTILANKLQRLGSQYRLILTGTPVQNNLLELWSMLHWLYPTVFIPTTRQPFQDAFNLTFGQYSPTFLDAAHNLLQIIMLRRTKQTVELSVPPFDEMVVFLPLTEVQRFWYLRLLNGLDTVSLEEVFNSGIKDDEGRREAQELVKLALSEGSYSDTPRYRKLLNLLLQLRRVCDHPFILKGCLPEPYEIGEHIVASSSKLYFIDKLLAQLLPKGERVLLFSQWTGMLDMLEDFMALRRIPYARLDGGVPRPRRSLDIRLFQQETSPYKVFLISTFAGGLGINLTKATHVVLCDSTWNPQIDRQAIARSHRIGQTKEVKVYRLICQDSVEDQMLDRLRRKLFLSVKIMTESNVDLKAKDPALKKNELLQILRQGANALSRWESDSSNCGLDAFMASSIQEILAKSKQTENLRQFKFKREAGEMAEDHEMEINYAEEEKRLLTGIAQVQTRIFEGRYHGKAKKGSAAQMENMEERAPLVGVNDIESIPAPVVRIQQPSQDKRTKTKRTWEHEDYCLACKDGGDLVCCNHCPRVFHPSCIDLPQHIVELPIVKCSQHACASCGRKTSQAGGMLFRCRRCPQALCEDCLPEGDLAAIGGSIPELEILGYGEVTQVYWIYCGDCEERAKEDTAWERSCRREEDLYAKKLEKLMAV